ncbi:VWA domain-containing protein [Dactylosporangium sp. NPDC048998]|uniref:VWA domain-containing protein n=1 Tax=Dactylosporangium sp. NPDC048998 TaxID=3363976 RepID=UPI00371A73BB
MPDDRNGVLVLVLLSAGATAAEETAALRRGSDRANTSGLPIARQAVLRIPADGEVSRLEILWGVEGGPFAAVVVDLDPRVGEVRSDDVRRLIRRWFDDGVDILVPFGKLSRNETLDRLCGPLRPPAAGLPDAHTHRPQFRLEQHEVERQMYSARRAGAADDEDSLGRFYDDDMGMERATARLRLERSAPGGSPERAKRDGPLPHDGLFVRRNNAFGTRSAVGIRDLIDNGVLIEQSQIRFDDFVSDTDAVPLPPPGRALAVSFGAAAVVGDAKAEPATTHFIEIALRAAPSAPAHRAAASPVPVNFVFVVDVSGSMSGAKLDTVKVAVRELYRKLSPDDVLGIVAFDTGVQTVLPSIRRADLSADDLAATVGALRAGGGTDLNLGLQYGIAEIRRHDDGAPSMVNCVYLFSDGEPNSGESNWINIRRNAAELLRGDITLSCFGFGSDARTGELDALAGLTGGHSTFVTDPMDIRLTLADDLQRRDRLAAMNLQLRIDLEPDVVLWRLYGHDLVDEPAAREAILREADELRDLAHQRHGVRPIEHIIDTPGGVRIFAPDLAFGETYWVVLEVQLPPGRDQSLGTATVQYADTVAHEPVTHTLPLTGTGGLSAETVLAHGIGLWTSEVTFAALDDLYANDRASATARINRHIGSLKAVHHLVPLPQFRDDQVTLTKFLSLAGNLGRVQMLSDVTGQFTMYTMSSFGRARGGYAKNTG